jgi:hypothetical protein
MWQGWFSSRENQATVWCHEKNIRHCMAAGVTNELRSERLIAKALGDSDEIKRLDDALITLGVVGRYSDPCRPSLADPTKRRPPG